MIQEISFIRPSFAQLVPLKDIFGFGNLTSLKQLVNAFYEPVFVFSVLLIMLSIGKEDRVEEATLVPQILILQINISVIAPPNQSLTLTSVETQLVLHLGH